MISMLVWPPAGVKRPATTLGAHKRRLCTVRIEASYSASGEQLELRIFEVEGLLERKYGKPDLYVKLYLSPDPKKTTKVQMIASLREMPL